MRSPARLPLPKAPEEWTRRRLQILFAVAITVVVALLVGGVWSIRASFVSDPGSGHSGFGHPAPGRSGGQSSPEDRLAAAPLRAAPVEAAQPGPLSTGSTGTIWLPAPESLGAAQVQTGFPHTAEGALAQLIAIDQRALGSASVVTAQDVIAGWATPGGPTRRTWSGVRAVVVLLSSAGMPADGTDGLQVRLRPAMGFIKGHVGEDFVVPCVDFVATFNTQAEAEADAGISGAGELVAGGGAARVGAAVRVAVADCQRMLWRGERWVIGPGAEPSASASVWPGTGKSYEAGYQWLRVSP